MINRSLVRFVEAKAIAIMLDYAIKTEILCGGVECLDCGINTAGHTTQNEAITSWNRRPAAHMYTDDELYDKNGSPVWGEVYGYELFDAWLLVDADNRELIDCTGQRYSFRDVMAYDREPEGVEDATI